MKLALARFDPLILIAEDRDLKLFAATSRLKRLLINLLRSRMRGDPSLAADGGKLSQQSHLYIFIVFFVREKLILISI